MQRVVVPSREIAAVGALDLDDVGAQVRELARTEGRGDGLFERDDANAAGERESPVKTTSAFRARARRCKRG